MSATAHVAGKVLDADGNAVAWVPVYIRAMNWRRNIRPALTQDDGQFEFTLLEPSNAVYLQAGTRDSASPKMGPLSFSAEGLDSVELHLSEVRDGGIEGILVNEKNVPVVGAMIIVDRLSDDLIGGGNDMPGEDGRFSIKRLAPGQYRIMVRPPGRRTWSNQDEVMRVAVESGQTVRNLQVVYAQGLALTGRVLAPSGRPLRDAWIHAYGPNSTSASAQTDRQGNYQLHGLDPGDYRITASHNKFSPSEPSSVTAGSHGADFNLEAYGAIAGKVIAGDTGRPIEAYSIMADHNQNIPYLDLGQLQRRGFKQIRDANGRFELDQVRPGEVFLVALAPGYMPGFAKIEGIKSGGTVSDAILTLHRGARANGRVVTASGDAIEGAMIFLGPVPYPRFDNNGVARTDNAGRFELEGLRPERQLISALHPYYAIGTAWISPSKARDGQLEITLGQGAKIEGRVTAAGAPTTDYWVTIEHPRRVDLGSGHSTQKRADGGYIAQNVLAGLIEVRATWRGPADRTGNRSLSKFIEAHDGETMTLNFDFPAGTGVVQGHVHLGGRDPRAEYVEMRMMINGGVASIKTPAQADGTYKFEDVPAGPVEIRYPQWHGSRASAFIDVGAGIVTEHDFVLDVVGDLRVTIQGRGSDERAILLLFEGAEKVPTLSADALQVLWAQALDLIILQKHSEHIFRDVKVGEYTIVTVSSSDWREESLASAKMSVNKATVRVSEETTVRADLH